MTGAREVVAAALPFGPFVVGACATSYVLVQLPLLASEPQLPTPQLPVHVPSDPNVNAENFAQPYSRR